MKITIPKTLISIGVTIAYIVWMILITISRVTQIFPGYILNIILSSVFTIVYACIYFYLAAILKAKSQKQAIFVSFIIFTILSTIFSTLTIVHRFDYHVIIVIGIINFLIATNLVIQCFRVKDETVGLSFKILGLTMLLKMMAIITLPFISAYFADYYSRRFLQVANLTPVMEVIPMVIICSIFFQTLTDLKRQQQIWEQLNNNYKPDEID
jgi:hypothetical protein